MKKIFSYLVVDLPDRNNFSIISNELLAGPRVASCFVAFLNLIGNGVTPIDGSIFVTDD